MADLRLRPGMITVLNAGRAVAVICAGVIALACLPGPVMVTPVAETGCRCENVLNALGDRAIIPAGKQPVLFVHGMAEGPDLWNGDGGLARSLDKDPGYVAVRFDYARLSNIWVNDSGDGGKSAADLLADAINCVARQTGKKLIIVAHSMGGLATQAALGKNNSARDNIAGLISVGTPWRGMTWPADATVPGNSLPVRAMTAMNTGTKELRELSSIPARIPVQPVAGTVTAPALESSPTGTASPPGSTGSDSGQRVSLLVTDVNLVGIQRQALVPAGLFHDLIAKKGFDPWVSVSSALDPPVESGVQLISPATLECKIEENPACWKGPFDGGFHDLMASDPKFAEVAKPTIEHWRQQNSPSVNSPTPGCA